MDHENREESFKKDKNRFKQMKIEISRKSSNSSRSSSKDKQLKSADYHKNSSKSSKISSFSHEKFKKTEKSEYFHQRASISPGLMRNQRNSFQISLRPFESCKKPVFSQGKNRENSQILDEVEELLSQGIAEIPEESLKFDESLTAYFKGKSENLENSKEKEGFFKLLLLYKTENKKAISINEKYHRNIELLEMESMHRTKLEEKHQELLKNHAILQEEYEKLRVKEQEFLQITQESLNKSIKTNENLINPIENVVFERKNLKKMTRVPRKNKETIGISPKLGQKVNIEYKQNTGIQLLEKIKQRKMKKFENFMHIKLVLKQINLIYSERINSSKENELSRQVIFSNSVYNYYFGLFGLKKIADRRFIIFVLSLKKNANYFRITMFSRLFGLFDEKTNYTKEELNKYIEALDFCLNTSNLGVSIANPESDSRYYIPYIRAIQYTGLFADTRMTNEENSQLKLEIEKLKENDNKGINKAGIIDFDLFMERMLSKYRHLVNKAKTYVINAFAACDLDGNNLCNLAEFLLLNRHIEKEKYDKILLKKIFFENADIIDAEGEKNLDFDKFSVLCVEYNLFSDESQNRYLGITKKAQVEIKLDEVKIVWYLKKFQMIESFDRLTVINKEEKENWMKIINVLEERIMGNSEENSLIKPTLIAYNILIQELELLEKKEEDREKGIDVSEDEDEEEEEVKRIGEVEPEEKNGEENNEIFE